MLWASQVLQQDGEAFGLARVCKLQLRSSVSVFLTPGMWPTSRARPRAWAQEALFARKKLSGKAVVKSLFTEARVGLLSLLEARQKRRLEQPVAS